MPIEIKRPRFQPDGDRVLIFTDPSPEKTKSGLYIVMNEEMNQGTCVRVGPDSNRKEGDRIIFSKLAGTIITIDGTDFKIMRKSDVFGVIENEIFD